MVVRETAFKVLLSVIASLILLGGLLFVAQPGAAAKAYADSTPVQEVYRLYNPWTNEHLYTTDKSEYNNLVKKGWNGEGTAWYAPLEGKPVYRLYNKWSGDHHYTTSKSEYEKCEKAGWKAEDVAFKSGGD